MAGTDERDPYKILQVDPSAESSVIESAYKALVKKYHPDVNAGEDTTAKMQDINWARDLLGDVDKRAKYDRDRKLRAAKPAYPPGQPWQNAARPANPTPASGTKTSPGSSAAGGSAAGGSAARGKTGGERQSNERATGSRTWGRPADDEDPLRRRYDPPPDWTRPPARPQPRTSTPPRPDERPFARAARGEAAAQEDTNRTSPGYQRPFERGGSASGGSVRDNPARPTGRYGPAAPPRDEPRPRATGRFSSPFGAAQDDSRGSTGSGSTPPRDEPRARPTGRFTASPFTGQAERRSATESSPWFSTGARPAGSTRRRVGTLSGDVPQRVSQRVKTLWASLGAEERLYVVLGVLGLVVMLVLLLGLLSGDGGDSNNSSSTEITVPYGATAITGHWITIWGEAYRASIQTVVDEAAYAANSAPPLVLLGGFVFADALNRPYGFYCPPTSTYNPNATPTPPGVLDACMPVTLSPQLSGYVE